jgi:hypothetical protein
MTPTRRLTLIVVALVLVVSAGLFSGLLLPQWSRLGELRQQEAVAQAKLGKLERLMRRRPAIERAHEAYAEYRSDEPGVMAQRVFLDELEQLSGEGLHLNLKPKATESGAAVPKVAVEIEVDGDQAVLMEFLDRLLAWPRMIEIERLRIGPSPSREYPLRAFLVINKLLLGGPASQAAAK